MNDNSVVVSIVGDSSGVAPAIAETKGEFANLQPILSELNASMGKLTAQMKESMAAGAGVGKGIAAGMKEARVATEEEGNAMTRLIMKVHEGAESVRTFQMRAKEFAELYVAIFAVDAVAEWAAKMGEAAERTQHLAQMTGLTVPQVQGLSGAAQMSGTNIEVLAKSIGMMDVKMTAAYGHTNVTSKAFAAMGVNAKDGATNLERLIKIADHFQNMGAQANKAAIAVALFGKSGREMIPFLMQGGDAIREMMERTKAYGVENEAAQATGMALADSVNESKVAWMGLKATLTEAFGPMLIKITEGFQNLVVGLTESYRSGGMVKIIFDGISEVFAGVGEILSTLGAAFSEVFRSTTAGAFDWKEAIHTVVTAVVESFKGCVAIIVFVADAFIATYHVLKGAGQDFLLGFVEMGAGVRIAGTMLGEFMGVVGKVCSDALHLNFGAIAADWSNGMDRVKAAVTAKTNEILGETNRLKQGAQADFAAAMGIGASYKKFFAGLDAPGGGEKNHKGFHALGGGGGGENPDITSPGKGKKSKAGKDELVQHLNEELEAKKTAWELAQEAQGTAQKFSLQSEADFWAQALKRHDLSAKDRLAIERKFITASQALKREENAVKIDGFRQEMEAAGANADAKKKIADRELAFAIGMYGKDSAEARKAADEILKIEREKAAQTLALRKEISKETEAMALGAVAAEEATAQFAEQMGEANAKKKLQTETKFENERYAIKLKALKQALELEKLDPQATPEKLAQINAQLEALSTQHEAALTKIKRNAVLERTKLEREGIATISKSFGDHISKMITLQEGWRQGLVGIYQSLVGVVASTISQMLEKWVAAFLTKLILGKQEAAHGVAQSVGQAGAGGVASMAAAPFPLNLTAPAFGASMAAAAGSFGSISLAEGGDWQVKEGLYGLHKDEMVLPAWAASPLRSIISSAGSSGGGLGQTAFGGSKDGVTKSSKSESTFHYSPTIHHSSMDLKEAVNRDGRDMRKWFMNQVRNGALQPAMT